MQGNTAPIGGTGGWSPSSSSGRPGGLHLQVPPTTQPSGPSSSAGGFITPTTLSPSPGGHTPPPPGNNSGFAGGFAPQGPPPPIVPRNPQQDEFVTCSPCFCFWPAFELNCVFVRVDVIIGSWRSTRMGVGRYRLWNCVRFLSVFLDGASSTERVYRKRSHE